MSEWRKVVGASGTYVLRRLRVSDFTDRGDTTQTATATAIPDVKEPRKGSNPL